jgi:hypothetical protein
MEGRPEVWRIVGSGKRWFSGRFDKIWLEIPGSFVHSVNFPEHLKKFLSFFKEAGRNLALRGEYLDLEKITCRIPVYGKRGNHSG